MGAVDDHHALAVHEDRRKVVGVLGEDPDVVGVFTVHPRGETGPQQFYRDSFHGQCFGDGLQRDQIIGVCSFHGHVHFVNPIRLKSD
ncbi:hypothetical protein [Streptomyces sp. C8S0]|uniref:hypothetical protein n=1 Tax=Streptomyces sp. C8S0 TaxID=2585716 RepID=UPI001D03C940|nr:hypothetical protein [Streptomyces sp. C8S0]